MIRDYERLESSIFIPKPFFLLTNDCSITHKDANTYWIVESKNIPSQTPIIRGSSVNLYHEKLVDYFFKSRASVSDIQKTCLWRKSDNFSSNKYYTLTIVNRLPITEILCHTFEPSPINMVDENKVLFFSKDYYEKIEEDTLFDFQGYSSYRYLIPLY
jgi:hypothetical protein